MANTPPHYCLDRGGDRTPSEDLHRPQARASVESTRPIWIAALLVLIGGCLRIAPSHHEWTLLINTLSQAVPGSVWGALSLLGLGWAAVSVVCLVDRSHRAGRDIAVCLVLGGVVTHGLKALLAVPRPGLVIPEGLHIIGAPILQSGAMPSGHTLAAFAMATLLSRRVNSTASLSQPAITRILNASIWALAALIGLSRIAVGAHWLSDVIVGAGLGIGIALLGSELASRLSGVSSPNTISLRQVSWLAVFLEITAAMAAVIYDEGLAATVWIQWVIAAVALASALQRFKAFFGTRTVSP